jgi:hypothetical protein
MLNVKVVVQNTLREFARQYSDSVTTVEEHRPWFPKFDTPKVVT